MKNLHMTPSSQVQEFDGVRTISQAALFTLNHGRFICRNASRQSWLQSTLKWRSSTLSAGLNLNNWGSQVQECRVAKLFAKHFKVEEQQRLLEASVVGIASGTPNRLSKLADLDALKLDRLRLLVLDVHIDAKQRCAPALAHAEFFLPPYSCCLHSVHSGFAVLPAFSCMSALRYQMLTDILALSPVAVTSPEPLAGCCGGL